MAKSLVLRETKTSIILEIPRSLLKKAVSSLSKVREKSHLKTIEQSEKEYKLGKAKTLNGSLLDLLK